MRNLRIYGWAVIFTVTLYLTACASHDAQMATTDNMSGLDVTMAQLEVQEDALTQQTLRLDTSDSLLEEHVAKTERQDEALAIEQAWLKALSRGFVGRGRTTERTEPLESLENVSRSAQMADVSDLFPPNAKPGRCYARVFVPAEFQTVTDKILKKDAGEKVEIVPARYETVSEEVLVESGSLGLKVNPTEYAFVEEQALVEPAQKKLVHIPAQYELVTEQVMVKPGHTVWKKGTGPFQQVDRATGEILCLVDVPAQYQTVSKSILKTPASTREIEIPAVYKTVQRRVIVTPGSAELVDVPAKYKTVQVTKMLEPAHEKRVPVPAQYQTVTKQRKVSEDHVTWQEILCETNMSHDKVSVIQRALAKAGYNPGPIDGVIGPQTLSAIKAFQIEHNLAVADYLTIDTITALEVNL